jgi:hypothetical protein
MTLGRVTLIVKAQGEDNTASARYQVDTPAASVRMDAAGEYRIATMNGRGVPETELAVVRGAAQLATDAGAMIVRAGERSTAVDGAAPAVPHAFNSARFDAFDRWIATRQEAWLGSTSTQYLPQDVQMYAGAFDRYGSWGYDTQYGNVWYPTVAATWRPYYNGYWNYYPGAYGWFWIGSDPWGWPTHHYGRWGYHSNRWFWIPGRYWAPAWVSWAVSPAYVSWCPLGFNGGPVFSFGFSATFGYGGWHGWTTIPRYSFGRPVYVSAHAVNAGRLAPAQRSGFVVQRTGPQPPMSSRAFAVPRASGTRAPVSASSEPTAFNRRFDRPITDPRAGSGRVQTQPLNNAQRGAAITGSAVPRSAPTRITPDRGTGYVPYNGSFSIESPYDRAGRVAAERAPGTGRQPLRGDTSYNSPYPQQYRSPVPEPFRPPDPGQNIPQYAVPYGNGVPYGTAVPRGYGRPDVGGPMTPGTRVNPGGPSSGVTAQPRGGPGAPTGGGVIQRGPVGAPQGAPPPSRGGGERAVPRGGDQGGGRASGGRGGGGR